jgi:hypothetical protein
MIPPGISHTEPIEGGQLDGDEVVLHGSNLGLMFEQSRLEACIQLVDLTHNRRVPFSCRLVGERCEAFTFHGAGGPEEAATYYESIRVRVTAVEPGHRYRLCLWPTGATPRAAPTLQLHFCARGPLAGQARRAGSGR